VKVTSEATLNLAKLLLHNGEEYEEEGSGLLMPPAEMLEADNLRLNDPIEWELIVRSTGGDDDYVVEGHASATAVLECRRCLIEVDTPIATDFFYPMLYKPGPPDLKLLETSDEEDETLVFGRPQVDFTSLITQLLAIELPLTALCKDDCKGLSPEGINLNQHPELAPKNPAKEEKPSPFAPLKNLEL
jgi:uncharacterized protein